jgi:hypothetical protein
LWSVSALAVRGRFNLTSSLDTVVGPLTARAQWTRRGGYLVLFNALQTSADAYNLIELYSAYDLEDNGFTESTQLTVNIDNADARRRSCRAL